ncbi:hypothetical protein N2152v2_008085 [Parachlorella kessleri]
METSEASAVTALAGASFASADTLNTSVAFLRNTLAGLGFCQDLNLLSTDPEDVVQTCNTIYGLLLQHQKDSRFKDQLKAEVHRLRLDMQTGEKERVRLDSRLQAKEREIGGLLNKQRAADEACKQEVAGVRRECEDQQKRLAAQERRVVQLQHEVKRKEKEYERLQERLAHHLADKKKSDKAVLDMAGRVTQQLQVEKAVRRTDEGLKAVVAAYEQRQGELVRENKDLKASLASMQAEYKEVVNRQVKQQQADVASAAGPLVDDNFLQAVPGMSEEELRAELNARMRQLSRRVTALSSSSSASAAAAAASSTPRPGSSRGMTAGEQSPAVQRLAGDLQVAQSVIQEQERLLGAMLSALRAAQQSKEAQHAADMKRLAQHYQAQLAAAEGEIQKAREAQADAAAQLADEKKEELRQQLTVFQAQLESERASAAAQAEALAASLERERLKLASSVQAERLALQAQAQEVIDSQRRFEQLQRTYQDLMRKWAPGVGAGLLLERAISRKAAEAAATSLGSSEAGNLSSGQGMIPAGRPISAC